MTDDYFDAVVLQVGVRILLEYNFVLFLWRFLHRSYKFGFMAQHNDLGRRGEDIAASYLRDKGYTILDRNWHYGDIEIDIIARDGDTLVLVEVKTRSSDYFHTPEHAVDYRRKRRMTIAMNVYCKRIAFDGDHRYDVIGIVLNDEKCDIKHYEGAFTSKYKQYTGYRRSSRLGY